VWKGEGKKGVRVFFLRKKRKKKTIVPPPPPPLPLSAERLTGLVIQQHHEAITINSTRCARRTQPTMLGLISLKLVTDFYILRPDYSRSYVHVEDADAVTNIRRRRRARRGEVACNGVNPAPSKGSPSQSPCYYRLARCTVQPNNFSSSSSPLFLFHSTPKLYRVLICCCYTLPKGNAAMASILLLLLLLGIPLTKKRAAESPRSFQTVVSRTTVNINGSKLFPSFFLHTIRLPRCALCRRKIDDRKSRCAVHHHHQQQQRTHTCLIELIRIRFCGVRMEGGNKCVCVVFPFFLLLTGSCCFALVIWLEQGWKT